MTHASDFEALRPALLAFATRLLGDHSAAEDLVQDCLAQALRQTTPQAQPRAWIYKVLRNRCHNLLRDTARRRDRDRLQTGMDLAGTQAGALTQLVRAEDGAALWHSLAQLSARQREVLELRYLDDLGRAEIAEVLGLEVAVVKSRLFEGVQRLRQLQGGD